LQKAQKFLLGAPIVGGPIGILFATIPTFIRFGAGSFSVGNLERCKRPSKRLIVYEYEGCPFCRKVREALSTLALDAEIRPCPRETLATYGFSSESRFRPEVKAKGGSLRFPFLVDEGNNVAMYESSEIVAYLWREYGDKATVPWSSWVANLPVLSLGTFVASLFRLQPEHGILRCPSKKPKEPLEFWSTESSVSNRLMLNSTCKISDAVIVPSLFAASPARPCARWRSLMCFIMFLMVLKNHVLCFLSALARTWPRRLALFSLEKGNFASRQEWASFHGSLTRTHRCDVVCSS
jgi:glutaredoxin